MASNSLDMLVDLYQPIIKELDSPYEITRVLSPSSDKVLDFIGTHFSKGWVSEAKAGLYKNHPTCFIARDDAKIVGFACYDATAKAYFGPTGVDGNYRGKGIGKALLLKCLVSMKEEGYGYAIIGGVEPKNWPFYEKVSGAVPIKNSKKIYQRMV
ncbi:MAG: GNAT family N-acetyltransferase [Tenericutes bacterium]|nr:GNAT family N-acetyltransferase [Mycoplasmatota bacterium]